MSGGRAAALLLVGVLIGGISGGAAATYVVSRYGPQAAATVAPAPSASSILPVPTAAATGNIPLDQETVSVVRDLLPTVVTVINYAANRQPQSSGSGFVVEAQQGYIVTNNHVVEDPRTADAGASFDVVFSDDKKVSARLVSAGIRSSLLQSPPKIRLCF